MTDSPDVLEATVLAAIRLLIKHKGRVSAAEDALAGELLGSLQTDIRKWQPADQAKLLVRYAAWQMLMTAEKSMEEDED